MIANKLQKVSKFRFDGLPLALFHFLEGFFWVHEVLVLLQVSTAMKTLMQTSQFCMRSLRFHTPFDVAGYSFYFVLTRLQFLQTLWSINGKNPISYCHGHPITKVQCMNRVKFQSIVVYPVGVSARLDFATDIRNWDVLVHGITCKVHKQYETIALNKKSKNFCYEGSLVKLLFELMQDISGWEVTIDFEHHVIDNGTWLSPQKWFRGIQVKKDIGFPQERLDSSVLQPFNISSDDCVSGRKLQFHRVFL